MTTQYDETDEMMTAIDKDIAFITGEGVGEPLGVLPDMWQAEMKDVIVRTWCVLPPYRNIRREFNEMAASLEEQLRKEIPLIDLRVARYGESYDCGLPPNTFSIAGKVTIEGMPFNFTIGLSVEMWQAYVGGYPVEFLVHRIASAIAEAIVEWRPKEAP